MRTIDFRPYPEDVLTLLEQHMPAWRTTIVAERARRTEQQRLWNSTSLLAEHYRMQREWRFQVGYSANEEARGVDEWESEQHHEMWQRIRVLRQRSLQHMNRRHRRHMK